MKFCIAGSYRFKCGGYFYKKEGNLMKLGITLKTILSALGAFVGYVWGGWTMSLQVLTALIVLDYLLGVIGGYIQGKLSSSVGFKGIAKKVAVFLFIAVAHFVDKAIGHGSMVQDAVTFFYIGNELLSIVENGGIIGIPVPNALKNAIEVLKAKNGGNNNKGE